MEWELGWELGVFWIMFCLLLIGLIWRHGCNIHYDKQEEEYQARLKREKQEREFKEAMRKRADPKERNGNG